MISRNHRRVLESRHSAPFGMTGNPDSVDSHETPKVFQFGRLGWAATSRMGFPFDEIEQHDIREILYN